MLFKFVEHKQWYFLASGLIIVPGLIFLLLGGLKPGIEFRGGTLLDVRFATAPPVAEVHEIFVKLGHPEATVLVAEGERLQVRTTTLLPDDIAAAQKALQEKYANVKDLQSNSVSASFSAELIQNAVQSIALASILIVLLIAFAFRSFGWSAFRYGIAAIVRSSTTPRSCSVCSRSSVISSTSRSIACS